MIKRLYVLSIIMLVLVTACGRSGWQFVSPMPDGRYWHHATLGNDGKIYVMGGMVISVTEKGMVFPHNDGKYSNLVYDPMKNKWHYLTPVPGKILPGKFLTYDNKRKTWDYHRYHHGMQLPPKARRTDFLGLSQIPSRDAIAAKSQKN